MRILWLSHLIPYPPKGGVLQRAYFMLREVAKYHDVDLIAFNQKDLITPLFPSLERGIEEAEKELGTFCKRLTFLPIASDETKFGKYDLALRSILTTDPYTINWLKGGKFGDTLKEHLSVNRYDLIHIDTISLMPYFDLIGDIPAVLDHHNIESHMLFRRAENERSKLKKWYFLQEGRRLQRYEERVCPDVALNITCSQIDADRLEAIAPGSRVVEVANGVDIDYFKPDEDVEQEQSLLFVGTLSWYPNIEAVHFIAYEIWPKLKQLIPHITIDIIGANPPDDIVHLANSDPSFRVYGFVDDVRPYFNRAAVYVCPINDGGGTKLKILDALSMQKAIVAHPIAFEGIEVSEGKNVLFASTVDEYISAIQKLLDDKSLRRSLGKQARKLIETEYSYVKIGKQLSEFYERCSK